MKPGKQSLSTVLMLGALLLFASAAVSQTRPPAPPSAQQPNASQSGEDKHETDVDFGSRETDARTNLAIKAEKKAYDEHVARAKEAKQLAVDLKAAYNAKQIFSAEDQKKLERLEKLTRRIRNDVGGSENNADPKDLPKSMPEGVESIARMADELCEQVEKTPRHVISTAIIDQANKLISVIQFLRDSRR